MSCGSGGDLRAFQAFLTGGDGCTICSYFIFRLTALLPLAVLYHHAAHMSRIYIFSRAREEGGVQCFLGDSEQKLEKEREGLGLKGIMR